MEVCPERDRSRIHNFPHHSRRRYRKKGWGKTLKNRKRIKGVLGLSNLKKTGQRPRKECARSEDRESTVSRRTVGC